MYIIHFMQAKPDYTCLNVNTNTSYPCTADDFCSRPGIKFKVDYSTEQTIKNFITDFDLHCIDKVQMSMMGTVLFIGYTLSCLILPRLADIHGRKKIFCGFYHFHALGTAVILFLPSYIGIYIGLFMIGISSSIRSTVGYVYALEFIQFKHQNVAGTVLKTVDVMTPILFSLLFMYVSKDWRPYYYAGLAISMGAWVSSLFIPESPSLLMAQ